MKRAAKRRKTNRKSHLTPLEEFKKFGVRLVHHKHTGRRVPVQHTAYSALFFMLALAGATLFLVGTSVNAGPPQTYSGDINLSGIVPGDPPSTPANFTHPKSGIFVYKSEVTLKGTCEPQEHGRLIEIYRLKAFAGSTACTPDGTFEITITLVPGRNEIVARTVDWVGQYGPDSETLIIFYDVTIDGPNATFKQLPVFQIYTADHIFKAVKRNKEFTFKYHIAGGKPPYAVTVDWGDDSRDDVASVLRPGVYNFSHTYKKAGLYVITFSAVDFYSNKSTFQVVVVVNETSSPPNYIGPIESETCAGNPNNVECYVNSRVAQIVEMLWPAFIVACLMTLSFWLGERVIYARYFHHKGKKVRVA